MYHEEERPIIWFDSVADQAEYADAKVTGSVRREAEREFSWSDVRTDWQGFINLAKVGTEENAEQAMKLLEKFDLSSETTGRHYAPNVCGAYPVVPEYLAGNPENMRSMVYVTDELQPIRVFVGTTSSAGVSAELLETRGIAILALVMSIAKIRPMALYLCTPIGACRTNDGEDYAMTVTKVNTSPLDLASATFALTHPGYSRCLSYKISQAMSEGYITKPDGTPYRRGSYGSWAHVRGKDGKIYGDYHDRSHPVYIARMREILGMEPQDIWVPEVTMEHIEDVTNDPVDWVRRMLAKVNELDAV